MFGILSRRRQSLTNRPSNRTRLQCEQLGDRLCPVTGTFSSGSGFGAIGQFTYDETLIDPSESSQIIPFTDLSFTTSPGGWDYTADESPVNAVFQGGLFHSMEFGASSPEGPHLAIAIVGDAGTVMVGNPGPTFEFSVNVQIAPTIDFTKNTPGPQLDPNGVPIPGVVRVDVKWLGAPVGGGNQITYELYEVGIPGRVQALGVNNLGSAGNNTQLFSYTTGKQVQVKIILKDAAGNVLDSKMSGIYTVP